MKTINGYFSFFWVKLFQSILSIASFYFEEEVTETLKQEVVDE